jgi:hypothetical protein
MPIAAVPLCILNAGYYTLPYSFRARRKKRRSSSRSKSSSTSGPSFGCSQARYQSSLRRRPRVIIFKREDHQAHLHKNDSLRKRKKKKKTKSLPSSQPEGVTSETPSLLSYQSYLIECLHH